jgi:hypothetical protein
VRESSPHISVLLAFALLKLMQHPFLFLPLVLGERKAVEVTGLCQTMGPSRGLKTSRQALHEYSVVPVISFWCREGRQQIDGCTIAAPGDGDVRVL